MGFSNEQDTVEWLRIKGVPCDEKGAHIYKTTLPSPWSEVELADVRKVPLFSPLSRNNCVCLVSSLSRSLALSLSLSLSSLSLSSLFLLTPSPLFNGTAIAPFGVFLLTQ
jgi:hypothetical protein